MSSIRRTCFQSLVKAQQDQIDALVEELAHEPVQNRQLYEQKMTMPRRGLGEVL